MAGEEPIVEQTPAATAAEPVVAAPVEAPVAAPEAPKHPSEIPTLLETLKAPGSEAAKVEAKPETKVEEPKPDAAKPDEKAPEKVEVKAEEPKAETPVEVPVEYKFEFPENIKPQDEKVAAFTEFARENKLSPEAAQKAVGYFNDAATAFVEQQQRHQIDTWNSMRSEWRKEVLAHEVLGGASHLTAMGVVARARDLATTIMANAQPGTPKYEAAAKRIEDFVRVTGAGDHPVFHEILHALGGRLDEPRAPTIPPNPPKNNGVRPSNSLYAPKRQ